MIFVIATIEVKPGKRDAFLAEFHKLMPKVHKEKGCIEYGPAVDAKSDIKAQIPLRDNVVTIMETRPLSKDKCWRVVRRLTVDSAA